VRRVLISQSRKPPRPLCTLHALLLASENSLPKGYRRWRLFDLSRRFATLPKKELNWKVVLVGWCYAILGREMSDSRKGM